MLPVSKAMLSPDVIEEKEEDARRSFGRREMRRWSCLFIFVSFVLAECK